MAGVLGGVRPKAGIGATSARSEAIPEEPTALAPDVESRFTIIVPTRNEEGSVATLLAMLAGDLGDVRSAPTEAQ